MLVEKEGKPRQRARPCFRSQKKINGNQHSETEIRYFYGGDAHPPYYAEKVDPSERGYVEPELLDIFLALNRRTDRAAEQLAEIWPPKREGKSWGKEHGLVFYLGDHGEQLTGRDPPPHGNLVSPDVTRTMMLVESRAFASDFESNGLVRMADVYASIADVVGLKLNGSLFVGQSLFDRSLGSPNGSRAAIPSFSFYRPGLGWEIATGITDMSPASAGINTILFKAVICQTAGDYLKIPKTYIFPKCIVTILLLIHNVTTNLKEIFQLLISSLVAIFAVQSFFGDLLVGHCTRRGTGVVVGSKTPVAKLNICCLECWMLATLLLECSCAYMAYM